LFIFTVDYHAVTGLGVQFHGIEEQHQRWEAIFQADPIVRYRRVTRELRVRERLGFAVELGRWVGKYTLDQKIVLVAGVYAARWQKQAGYLWLVQTEVFTMLKFKGYDLERENSRMTSE